MARIRRANKNSNMMVVRANESEGVRIEIQAGNGNDGFANAWVAAEADGETPLEEAEVGTTVYLVVKADAQATDTGAVSDSVSQSTVGSQTGPGSKSFEVPETEGHLIVTFGGGK